MQSAAAYFLVIAMEQARHTEREPRYQFVPPKRRSRLVAFVSAVTAPVRRSAASAA